MLNSIKFKNIQEKLRMLKERREKQLRINFQKYIIKKMRENIERQKNIQNHNKQKSNKSNKKKEFDKETINKNIITNYFRDNNSKHIAFIDSWPCINNAEKELLQRFEISCKRLNITYLSINNKGIIINNHPLQNINIKLIDKNDILCVISLHFSSQKISHHYTLATLWNPLDFYKIEIDLKNTLSSDGFLSCYSNIVDNYFTNISNKKILGYLNTTIAEPILDYTFGDYKCFYIGINWEIVNPKNIDAKRSKILDILRELENNNMVSIYGPKLFHSVDVWKDFTSYQGEIPFDGLSIIDKIHKCGICLVLSSDSHIKYKMCSNRLFEGLAAGVPIISDNNPFIYEWFADNIFYINPENTSESIDKIKGYIEYFKTNPEDVLKKIENCREIFMKNFKLDLQIENLINNVENEKRILNEI